MNDLTKDDKMIIIQGLDMFSHAWRDFDEEKRNRAKELIELFEGDDEDSPISD